MDNYFSPSLRLNQPGYSQAEVQSVLRQTKIQPQYSIHNLNDPSSTPWLVGRESRLVTRKAVTLLNHKGFTFRLTVTLLLEKGLPRGINHFRSLNIYRTPHSCQTQDSLSALEGKVVFALEKSHGEVRNTGDYFNIISELRSRATQGTENTAESRPYFRQDFLRG